MNNPSTTNLADVSLHPKYPNASSIELGVRACNISTLLTEDSQNTNYIPLSEIPVNNFVTWLKNNSLDIRTMVYFDNAWHVLE